MENIEKGFETGEIKEGLAVKWDKTDNTFAAKGAEFTAIEAIQFCDCVVAFFTGKYYMLSNELPDDVLNDNKKASEMINDQINKMCTVV